jgi:5'-3' exonuclease
MVTSLTGDTSDNVDGIRGIGPKKAVKLLERHGWDLQRAILEEHPEHKELIERNMKLVDLVTVSCGLVGQLDMAIQPFTAPKPDSPEGEVLDYFLTAFELAEIQAKFHRGALWTGPLIAGRPLRRPPVMKGGLS